MQIQQTPHKNPILNNPYQEPQKYYYTNMDGTLNYQNIEEGRRLFSTDRLAIPKKARGQKTLLTHDEVADKNHIINLARQEVKQWREQGYKNTTRITLDLLKFWFPETDQDLNAYQRVGIRRLFFAQREAIETAIWLNEIATRSNTGSHILSTIREANKTASDQKEKL